jgi:hypothetical protein
MFVTDVPTHGFGRGGMRIVLMQFRLNSNQGQQVYQHNISHERCIEILYFQESKQKRMKKRVIYKLYKTNRIINEKIQRCSSCYTEKP